MADFIGANLLASVQKKIFPEGVAMDIMQRLDQMTFVSSEMPENLDSFDTKNVSVESLAYNIFSTYGTNSELLSSACKDAKMQIKVDSVETKYVADAEQTGSISTYTFTNRRGEKAVINNINAKEFLDKEQKEVDNILQGVLDEIIAGNISLAGFEMEEEAAA